MSSNRKSVFVGSRALSQGFTLVELLVVISIIGILVALLLPAIAAAREAARNTQCKQNLKEIGLAAQNHLSSWQAFPSGGWGRGWAGDPNRGFGLPQPGGWIYSLLPFLEEKPVWSLGQGLNFNTSATAFKSAVAAQGTTPLPIIVCPSLRNGDVELYPYNPSGNSPAFNTNYTVGQKVTKNDYAANCMDNAGSGTWQGMKEANNLSAASSASGPTTLAIGDKAGISSSQSYSGFYWGPTVQFTGIVYARSEIHSNQILDGLSNTIFVGEKYIDPDLYLTGTGTGDNEFATCGMDNDNVRSGFNPPHLDFVGNDPADPVEALDFGSVHTSGCNTVFCDGSVHTVSFQITATVMEQFCNRNDGATPNWNNVTHD
jgi:prepilin-type N-terminal cleavage/methylation domain-containing protein/prepilin-type processing-associated H-X9-DG protein